MDCWIGVVHEAERRVVRLAGRLAYSQVPELMRSYEGAASLYIDLTEMVSADLVGIDALRRLRALGATLVGVPGYIQLKLDSPPGAPTALRRRCWRPRLDIVLR